MVNVIVPKSKEIMKKECETQMNKKIQSEFDEQKKIEKEK